MADPDLPERRTSPDISRTPLLIAAAAALVVLIVGVMLVRPGKSDAGGPRGSGEGLNTGTVQVPRPINRAIAGLTTFRGNETRTFYGVGPVPSDPVVRWTAPAEKMCSVAIVGVDAKEWCGSGWTGQPNVIELPGGGIEVREGGYDGKYHFVDGYTGKQLREPLATRELAKGSATTDPEGYPLYYGGSRDGYLRVIALDRTDPVMLWSISGDTSVPRPLKDHDWDGSPLVLGDYLLEGGENGYLYVIHLRRGYDQQGLVTVNPKVVATIPTVDDELLAAIGDQNTALESSVSFHDGVVYAANSGGLVQGWDIRDLLRGGRNYERVFRFWTGDDTDATVVIDDDGFLYVASEVKRFNERSREVGQLMKLDPSQPEDPLVWSIADRRIAFEGSGGSWSTPALYGDLVFFATSSGRVLMVNRATGEIVQEVRSGSPTISSPVVVDGVLIVADCRGVMRAWDVQDPTVAPPPLWSVELGGCIEATPAVWKGWIYVAARDGYLYGLADADTGKEGG